MTGPLDRVWSAAAEAPREALERRLPPADLTTLLLGVARERASNVTPARVVGRWREDRFVRPSVADPRLLSRVEARLWGLLPETFAGVELSPLAPLGTCSAVAPIGQNRVVSTMRGTEVVSDCTNALAVEAAVRRGDGAARVDLATCQRVVRAQALDGPGLYAHFRLFALVSSARDTGSGRTEAAMLTDHLAFWAAALSALGVRARIGFTSYGETTTLERFHDTVVPGLGPLAEGVALGEDPDREQGRGYYAGGAVSIATDGLDIGDGGFTTWTAQLLGDAKERCLVSCVATERLATAAGSAP